MTLAPPTSKSVDYFQWSTLFARLIKKPNQLLFGFFIHSQFVEHDLAKQLALLMIAFLRLPLGKRLDRVSLPTSSRFKARSGTGSRQEEFEISCLDRAEIYPDGSVLLADGIHLRAVEVIPTRLPYELSDLSGLDKKILWYVILLTKAFHCFCSLRESLPEDLRGDCSRYPQARLRPSSQEL
jgi:hypothetical protein